MKVLVDSSVWIDYFRSGKSTSCLDDLIDANVVVVNDLILAELISVLRVNNQKKVIELLRAIEKFEIEIDWPHIIDLQVKCLKNGINKVGVPDLILTQHAIVNNLLVYTLDKHFKLLSAHTTMRLY